jgi:NAD(P)H-dependent flavin oxidoreductase YrpB (nitropropane dioxygenase family)
VKYRTGKYSRQLRSSWHDAWEAPGGPEALSLPVMSMLAEPAFALINRAARKGNPQARELVSYFVGQGVGLVDGIKSAATVVQEFKEDFADAVAATMAFVE